MPPPAEPVWGVNEEIVSDRARSLARKLSEASTERQTSPILREITKKVCAGCDCPLGRKVPEEPSEPCEDCDCGLAPKAKVKVPVRVQPAMAPVKKEA